MAVGVPALFVMAWAPDIITLGLGWCLTQLGWGAVLNTLLASQADRLPHSQRGKVAGLCGFSTMAAPVLGVVIAGGLVDHSLLLFLVPGLIGVIAVTSFVWFVPEDDSRGLTFTEPLTVRSIARKYVFSPRQNPDFAWNWLSKFIFMFGVTFNTTYTVFFFASRLDVTVKEVAGTIAVLSAGSVAATALGAVGGGLLSDRLGRRRVLVMVAALLFTSGAVTMALSSAVPMLFAGSLLCSLGNGAFSSVDQALALDVLPDRGTDAGRYMGVIGFAATVPQALAPLAAPLFLAVGAGGEKNYALLYLVAAAFTVLGGLTVLRVRSVR
jgi:MFS family permease